jgi:hypothetical protein
VGEGIVEYMTLNGPVTVEPGGEETLKRWVGGIINGPVICPESVAGILAGTVLAFRRCPFCGRYFRGWDWTVGPFKWRLFHCPDCDFMPYWD